MGLLTSHTDKEKNKINTLLQLALKKSLSQGATDAECTCTIDSAVEVGVRNQTVESLEHELSQQLNLIFYKGQRSAAVSTTDFSEGAINTLVEKVSYMASLTEEDNAKGLADQKDLATDYPHLDLDHSYPGTLAEVIESCQACENIALQQSDLLRSEGVDFQSKRTWYSMANTHGFAGEFTKSYHAMSACLIAEKNGQMQRDYDYTAACLPSALLSYEELAQKAAAVTLKRLGAKPISTRKCPVVFHSSVASSLIRTLYSALRGGAVYKKATLYADDLHKPILPPGYFLRQQPHLTQQIASMPFDYDGVKTQNRDFIHDGILDSFILSSYSARQLNMHTTGNSSGLMNVSLGPVTGSFEQMLKKMGTGFLVTEFIGSGVDLVSGEYSRGAFGYWVENGEIQFPVEGVTLAGQLRTMYKNIVMVADDIDMRGSVHTGSILLEEMTLAGDQ